MNINLEYYRVFYYVVKYHNFTQAANHLMNNQPNVTRMIRNLENDLGCRLFVRSNRGVTLTPEGSALYTHVKVAMEQLNRGENELRHLIDLQRGSLSIGVSEVALRCFLLPVLKEYQKRYPSVRLKVSNHSTPQAIAALQSGAADMAFVTTPLGDLRELSVTPIREIQEVPICGCAFSSITHKTLSLSELADYPIVSLGEQTKTHRFYSDLFDAHGLTFSPDVEAATADQVLPMVKNNLGIGFVPEEFIESEESGDIFRLKLDVTIPPRSICYVQSAQRPLSMAAKALEKMILSDFREKTP